MGDVDINTLTMQHYLALTRGNQAPGVVNNEIGKNVNFEIKSQFIRNLREDAFLGNKNNEAHEHMERVLNFFSLSFSKWQNKSSNKRTSSGSGNGDDKRDKTQAKPDKTEHKTESVEKSKVKSQQKVKPDKVEAKKIKKPKKNNIE
nr:hypothetical protein [Tanacetum cinerariifolium]